jgi:hypothetical protein
MDGSAEVAESCAFLALRSGELWAVLSRVFARQPRGRIATRATNDRKIVTRAEHLEYAPDKLNRET